MIPHMETGYGNVWKNIKFLKLINILNTYVQRQEVLLE